jgi:predicted flap endonuclease-1-like 5' DNA nuclease
MDFENMNIWCWLIPLLTGLICGIIGYYWGKGNSEVIDNSADLKVLEDKNTRLQADLDACNKKLTAVPIAPQKKAAPKKKPTPKAKVAPASLAAVAAVAFDANAAKTAFGKRIKQDDLKVVEGIGPKIEGLFHNFDIKTWEALSNASVAKCQEVLNSGGDRYRIHDPASWPLQAKMAYEGDWKKLAKWQDEHKGGKL